MSIHPSGGRSLLILPDIVYEGEVILNLRAHILEKVSLLKEHIGEKICLASNEINLEYNKSKSQGICLSCARSVASTCEIACEWPAEYAR